MTHQLHAVLVRPSFSWNVGASARALANMGGDRLILIAPECEINEEARQGAAGAQEKLRGCTVYPSWEAFYAAEGTGFRVALTRRTGKRRQASDLRSVLQQARKTRHFKRSSLPVYLIFGPEAHGLSADDLALCNQSASLPIQGAFQSLNLAQAVLLALFIAREIFPLQSKDETTQITTVDHKKPVYFPEEAIREWLTAMGFDIRKRRMSAFLTFKRLLLQNWPTDRELHVLEAILRQNTRKLKSLKQTNRKSISS